MPDPVAQPEPGLIPIPDNPYTSEPPDRPTEDRDAVAPRRTRPALILKKDQDSVAESILEGIQQARNERTQWMRDRLDRYYKLRGWEERSNSPWAGASDQHIPFIMSNVLRVEAGMYNAVMGIRPVVTGVPLDIAHQEAAVRNDGLLDYQMFVESDGEAALERYIINFVEDGTAISYQPRVVERSTLVDYRRIRGEDSPLIDWILPVLNELAAENQITFTSLAPIGKGDHSWIGTYENPLDGEPVEVPIEVYDSDDPADRRLEIVYRWPVTAFDGPVMMVSDLEDIIVPMRSENLQPISGKNPYGAPWVARVCKIPISELRKRVTDRVYDLLTDKDVEAAEEAAEARISPTRGANEDEIKVAKDEDAGMVGGATSTAANQNWITVYEWYGARTLEARLGAEEVVITVVENIRKVARARYLSEAYPVVPAIRPFAEARLVPVPGQFYGMSLVELQEGLSDLLHELINDNLDAGKLCSIPWFGYAASSGIKPEDLRLGPGDGIPLANPQQDLAFYSMPGKDQTWSFNMIGMALQWLERQVQIGAVQFGQVPQGKASALRTVGTTMALIQQGAAFPEQILRRLLTGIATVFEHFHLINSRFLPPKKRFLITGRPLDQPDSYVELADRTDIAVPLVFNFQATLTNTNKGLVAESLTALAQAIFSPLFAQTGLIGPEQLYNWASDFARANQQDPARYLKKPPGASDEPIITMDSAIRSLVMGIDPSSTTFAEGTTPALQKLLDFLVGPELGLVQGPALDNLMQFVQQVMNRARQEMMQAQMAAAAQVSQPFGGPGGGGGGRPPLPGQAPPPQTEAPEMAEIAGASGMPA